MQVAQTNLPHLQPTLINIYSKIKRNWATANIQKKKHNITSISYHSKMKQKSVVHVNQWLCK